MTREPIHYFRDRAHIDQEIYRETILRLEKTFHNQRDTLADVRRLAYDIKLAFEEISPAIQEITRTVCPTCAEVCCLSKHGYYNYEDLVYLTALGLKPPPLDFSRNDRDPCQFLAETGCSMERSLRPSGCNWYFCVPLLEVLENKPRYREFDDSLRNLAEMWTKMITTFLNGI